MVNAKTSTKDATWHTYIRCVVCRRRTKTSNPISSRHFYHSTIEEFISPPLVVKTYKARQLTSSARADATHETSTLTERCQTSIRKTSSDAPEKLYTSETRLTLWRVILPPTRLDETYLEGLVLEWWWEEDERGWMVRLQKTPDQMCLFYCVYWNPFSPWTFKHLVLMSTGDKHNGQTI